MAERAAAASEEAVVSRTWADLATNVPGQAARAQAQQLRDARPVATFLARFFGVHTDERAWRIGADGEERVARQLAKLDGCWRVLHAVPIGNRGADIDHVVIGPPGVFTINTKHHPSAKVWVGGNTVLVNGKRQPYVRNSRTEIRRAARMLEAQVGFAVPVYGLIVVVGTAKVTVKAQPEDRVAVLERRRVTRWLSDLGAIFPAASVDQIYSAARRSTTWA